MGYYAWVLAGALVVGALGGLISWGLIWCIWYRE